MKKSLNIVAIGAHPDDIEFSVLGTLSLLRDKGHNIHFIAMSAGNMGTARVFSEDIEAIRYSEAKASAQKLDAAYDCLGQRDLEISDSPESVREIVRLLREYETDIVITHPRDDYMLDHERTHRAVRAATNHTTIPRYCRFEVESRKMPHTLKSVPYLYYWSPPGGIDLYGEVFPAHFLITLSDREMKVKKEALAAHASQREWLKRHYGVDQYIKMMEKWASLWIPHFGLEEKTQNKYAEALAQNLCFGVPQADILSKILEDHVLRTKNYKLATNKNLEPRNRFLK